MHLLGSGVFEEQDELCPPIQSLRDSCQTARYDSMSMETLSSILKVLSHRQNVEGYLHHPCRTYLTRLGKIGESENALMVELDQLIIQAADKLLRFYLLSGPQDGCSAGLSIIEAYVRSHGNGGPFCLRSNYIVYALLPSGILPGFNPSIFDS